MQAVILAGGLGTRLMEKTQDVPKPMIVIDGEPLIQHIIDIYAQSGLVDEIIIAGGYKKEVIEEYLLGINGKGRNMPKVVLVDTGGDSFTGTRLKALEARIKGTFFFTYGDGLSDVNLHSLLSFHESSALKPIVTMTAVHPKPRFGRLIIDDESAKVLDFGEKIEHGKDWINGGFMVMDVGIFECIPRSHNTNFEKEILPVVAKYGKLLAHRHSGFWACVDALRDVFELEEIVQEQGKLWLR